MFGRPPVRVAFFVYLQDERFVHVGVVLSKWGGRLATWPAEVGAPTDGFCSYNRKNYFTVQRELCYAAREFCQPVWTFCQPSKKSCQPFRYDKWPDCGPAITSLIVEEWGRP